MDWQEELSEIVGREMRKVVMRCVSCGSEYILGWAHPCPHPPSINLLDDGA